MEIRINENFIEDSPYLLTGQTKQYYFYINNDGNWSWKEQNLQVWREAGTLPRQTGTLCAALDYRELPHLVLYADGAFYYLTYSGGSFAEELFYREDSKSCSHLTLIGDNHGSLHLLYLAVDEKAGRWWLLHHRHSDNRWEEPRVVDFGGGASINYGSAALDKSGSLHLVYRIVEHEQTSLYYRTFSSTSGNWSKALLLATEGDAANPSIIVDENQNLHVVWAAVKDNQNYIKYRPMIRSGWPGGGWKNEVTISPALVAAPFPFFSYKDNCLAMGWFDGGTITSYAYKKNSWEKSPPLQLQAPLFIRCSAFDPSGTPLLFWILTSGEEPLPALEEGSLGPDSTEADEFGPDFDMLQKYSETLVNRASSLSAAKARVEQSLEEKKRELSFLSQQNKKNMLSLQQSLNEKDKEIGELENKFNDSVAALKAKMEQSRKKWESERKTCLRELQDQKKELQVLRKAVQEQKKERKQFDLILMEKENTIAKLDSSCREQELLVKNLRAENEELAQELKNKGWSFKKILGNILHNKP